MIKVPLLRHQRYISPLQLTSRVKSNDKTYLKKNVDFDTFDGHVMVNFIEPNFQDIIFILCTVSLITQKWFSDHLKKWHFWGNTPYFLRPARLGRLSDVGQRVLHGGHRRAPHHRAPVRPGHHPGALLGGSHWPKICSHVLFSRQGRHMQESGCGSGLDRGSLPQLLDFSPKIPRLPMSGSTMKPTPMISAACTTPIPTRASSKTRGPSAIPHGSPCSSPLRGQTLRLRSRPWRHLSWWSGASPTTSIRERQRGWKSPRLSPIPRPRPFPKLSTGRFWKTPAISSRRYVPFWRKWSKKQTNKQTNNGLGL